MERVIRLAAAIVLAAASLYAVAQRHAEPGLSRQILFADSDWQFFLGDPAGAEASAFDASHWRSVNLPHDWSIEGAPDEKNLTGAGGGYFPAGVGWYRKTFSASPSWMNKRVSVEFDGVASNATVYLNGKKLGFHPYAYTSFRFDLSVGLDFNGVNVLAVRVDNSQQPSSRWYTGAGIYRHVRLVVTDRVHIAPWGVFLSTPEAREESATVLVRTEVQNETTSSAAVTVQTTIYSTLNKLVASDQETLEIGSAGQKQVTQKITIAHPELWSPQSPDLYRAVSEVLRDGKVIDRVETNFGVRALKWSAEKGLLLNGHSIKLAGGSVHHDNGPLGAAAFDRAEVRKIELLKAAGFNAVRSAHNPPSPAFLDACDRLGMLVLDESFDVWTKPKVIFDYARFFPDWWQADIDSMVLRDRNHPSVIFWGIGNEIPEGWMKEGASIAKRLADRVRSLDGTRPLTEAFPGATYTPSTDAVMAQVDVSGYNYNLGANQERDHQRVPSRLMMTTESLPPAVFDEWKLVHEHSYIIGEFVWTAMDYLGEAGAGSWSYKAPKEADQLGRFDSMLRQMLASIGANGKSPFDGISPQQPSLSTSPLFPGWPWHGAVTGDLDLIGYRKPQSHYRDILWNGGNRVFVTVRLPEPDDKKIVAIGWTDYPTLPSWTWPGLEGKEMQVEVYAGTEKVRLYLNDKLLGEMPTSVEHQRKAIFHVPFTPGSLKAVGLNGDREVATDVLQTVGGATKLALHADRTVLQADGEDLSFITVEAQDAQGRWQPNAANEVQFTISGPGTIIAVGNGDEMSAEPYQGSRRSLFDGHAIVVVRTSRTPGSIRLSATATGLDSSEAEIRSNPSTARPELK